MKPDSRLSTLWRTIRRKRPLRFFARLLLALALIVLLLGGGLLLSGWAALSSLADAVMLEPPVLTGIWADRLGRHYEEHDGWNGVQAMIASYPVGPAWGPWEEDWQMAYALYGSDGIVVAAQNVGQVDEPLRRFEEARLIPIEADGEVVGHLFLNVLALSREQFRELARLAMQRFLLTGLAIGALTLFVGLVVLRRLSRPLGTLTAATRAVAAGDLEVRVPDHYPTEMGELAASFNTMAAELARADEMRRSLTADVAHELRTPLSVIRGKLEGILDGVYPPSPEHLEPIVSEIGVLTHLVEDLGLLARAEAGQLELDRREMAVADLLQDAVVNFSPQASDRGVTLALDLPTTLPSVYADWRRIAQVLGNLLTNALRHTPGGGVITLGAAPTTTGVRIAVSDTGIGISPQEMPYIFERFWRGERSRSRAGGGTGLGLAIAKELVEIHGGAIGAESTPGQGTTIWFTLLSA